MHLPVVLTSRQTSTQRLLLHALAVWSLCAVLGTGCATSSSRWVALRTTPRNPLTESLGLLTRQGPKPTERTLQLLRRYDLADELDSDRQELLGKIEEIDHQSPSRDHVYAEAELAYVGAKKAERVLKKQEAFDLYCAAVLHAYRYLFDEQYATASNPYDPEFRRACDLYNAALEGALRIVQSQDTLRPDMKRMIHAGNSNCQIATEWNSQGWCAEDVDHFEFVSDYEIHGLRNHYHNFGLGVPLIAVRRKHEDADVHEKYYPEDLSFPVTAFLRVELTDDRGPTTRSAVLELHDPLTETNVTVASRSVPLETDLSTPLAHTLNQPSLDDTHLSTLGLLKPEKAKQLQGLYMLEPYQPDKIPVVMVHGLWSSPVTWMEMFNDLRSDPQIRKYYQFWFYMYPTGQPFWFSAAQMREDLAKMRSDVDPEGTAPALDQMVLVGHSMGGLVSKLQTVDSGNDFWQTLSEQPFTELHAEDEIRQTLAQTFFFDPNPSIHRVITIGTPHRGSEFANDSTRWLSRKLIRIPTKLLQGKSELIAANPGYFRRDAPLDISTSIDSLAPKSPLLPVLMAAHHGPWVRYNNIMGELPESGLRDWFSGGRGDGVVTMESARLDNAESQLVVPTDHSLVHRHPQSILEVRRILIADVARLRGTEGGVLQVSNPVTPEVSQPAEIPQPLAPVTVETAGVPVSSSYR